MSLKEKIIALLPTPGIKAAIGLSLTLSIVPFLIPNSALSDLRLSESTILWVQRLILSELILLVGAYISLALFVVSFRKCKQETTIKENIERDSTVSTLREKISVLEQNLMTERQRNSIPTVE